MNLTGDFILYALIIGFSAVIHGAAGIGFPMVSTPLLAMVTDVKTAVLLLVMPTAFINMANIIRGGGWRQSIGRYWPLAVYGMAGSYMGARLLILAPPELFRPLLALVIIFYLNAERLGLNFSWVKIRPYPAMAVFGIFAGILGGTVNVMLPALVIFALETEMDNTAMIQVFNFCFLSGKLTQGAVLFSAGLFTPDLIRTTLFLAVFALVIMTAAMTVRDRIPARTYRKWLRRLLAVMAVILIIQRLVPFIP